MHKIIDTTVFSVNCTVTYAKAIGNGRVCRVSPYDCVADSQLSLHCFNRVVNVGVLLGVRRRRQQICRRWIRKRIQLCGVVNSHRLPS